MELWCGGILSLGIVLQFSTNVKTEVQSMCATDWCKVDHELDVRVACSPLIMELMEGMKAKARCILRLFRGALTQNKVGSYFWIAIVYMYALNLAVVG
jgi:hypothetical protein